MAAHREGSEYDDCLAARLGRDGLVHGFARLLVEVNDMLERLHAYFLDRTRHDGTRPHPVRWPGQVGQWMRCRANYFLGRERGRPRVVVTS